MTPARCVRPGCNRPARPRPEWLDAFQLCDVHLAELNGQSGAYGKPPALEPPRRARCQPTWPSPKFHGKK
jgi:hypothetical protein